MKTKVIEQNRLLWSQNMYMHASINLERDIAPAQLTHLKFGVIFCFNQWSITDPSKAVVYAALSVGKCI